ncbi:hypothetical protein BU17DRAFT_87971 [Hysterangium stoloniferum]|nr:hypothetical protein BU17DRAFT_87971 [Hysterangium stoloniferum]
MHWEDSIDHPSSLFAMYKPERPLIHIPASRNRSSGGIAGHRDIDALRTPVDTPARHAPHSWYAAQDGTYPYQITMAPNDPHSRSGYPAMDVSYTIRQDLPPYAFGRMRELDIVPPSPRPIHLELHRGYDNFDMELSPPSPSRRSSVDLPSNEFLEGYHYGGLAYDHECQSPSPPSLSPPSPSPRMLSLLPDEEWQSDSDDVDCPALSPPSPRQGNSISPLMFEELEPQPLLIDDLSSSSSTSTRYTSPVYSECPSPLAFRLYSEHAALIDLRDRTIQEERQSRACNAALRARERQLGRAVAALREAEACKKSDGICEADISHLELDSSLQELLPLNTIPTLRSYRAAATCAMLQRTKEKSRRKKDKEKLKELGIILGVGVQALLSLAGESEPMEDIIPTTVGGLKLADASDLQVTTDLGIRLPALQTDKIVEYEPGGLFASVQPRSSAPQACEKPEPESAGLGLGLGLSLGIPAPAPPPLCSWPHAQLQERTRAMRRLTARMKIRRRDISMRSLLEAGNMAEISMDEEEEEDERDGSARNMHVKRAGGGSPLTKEVTFTC